MVISGGCAVRFLLGVPKPPKIRLDTALEEYARNGGTSFFEYGENIESFEHYYAEMQDQQQKRGRLAVVNGCCRGYRRFKQIVLGPDML